MNEIQEIEQAEAGISRRNLLAGTGIFAAGAALSQLGGLVKPAFAAGAGAKTEQWPWPYEKLDPEKTAELCYEEWYRVFCGAAVISSVFSQLREKVGEPYTSFPIDAYVYLEGGHVGWGTICGAPAGASMVANLIVGPRTQGQTAGHQIAEDMIYWYSKARMPIYTPKNPRITAKLPTTTSQSPLCHVSVGKWMKASGKSLPSDERKDRCARVAASTAYHLVELLNQWKDNEYDYEQFSDFNCGKEHGITGQFNCNSCHGANVPTAPRDQPKKTAKK